MNALLTMACHDHRGMQCPCAASTWYMSSATQGRRHVLQPDATDMVIGETAAMHSSRPPSGLSCARVGAGGKPQTVVPVVHELPADPAALPGLYVRGLPDRPWLNETHVAVTSQWRSSDEVRVPSVQVLMRPCMQSACTETLLASPVACNALSDIPTCSCLARCAEVADRLTSALGPLASGPGALISEHMPTAGKVWPAVQMVVVNVDSGEAAAARPQGSQGSWSFLGAHNGEAHSCTAVAPVGCALAHVRLTMQSLASKSIQHPKFWASAAPKRAVLSG